MILYTDPFLVQNDSDAVPSVLASNKDKQNDKEYVDKTELWEPLDCLFEAAKRTKALCSSQQSPVVKADQVSGLDSEVPNSRTNLREHPHKSKVQNDKNGIPISPLLAKARRLHGVSRRRRERGTSAQAQLDAVGCKRERKIQQFWCAASKFWQFGVPFDSILSSGSTLRIKSFNHLHENLSAIHT